MYVFGFQEHLFRIDGMSKGLNQDVHYLADSFDYVSFKHIYRERNFKADTLAKVGGSLLEGY